MKLFKFLHNLSLYCACYSEEKNSEEFDLKQYFRIKNELFSDSEIGMESQLTNFSFFDSYFHKDGSLLHRSTFMGYETICKVLINDKFNCMQINMKDGLTSYDIAQNNKHYAIVSLFDNYLQQAKENGQSSFNVGAIDKNYCDFKQQLIFSKYFLACLGCTTKNNIDRKNNSSSTINSKLYVNFSDFEDLIGDTKNNDTGGGDSVMVALTNVLLKLLAKNLPITQDLLVLCFEFVKNSNNNEFLDAFVRTLKSVCSDCLEGYSYNKRLENTKKTSDSLLWNVIKHRNHSWFRQNLLSSNIWLCNLSTSDEDSDDSKEREVNIAYQIVESLADKALLQQKQHIWNNVINEQKRDLDSWTKLTNYESFKTRKYNDIRHDCLKNGIKAQRNEENLYLLTTHMKSTKNNFDVFSEYTTKIYLTNCLLFAHSFNSTFQAIIKEFFTNDNTSCIYQSAPVKKYERCIIKSGINTFFFVHVVVVVESSGLSIFL